jgi:hypothetical protein
MRLLRTPRMPTLGARNDVMLCTKPHQLKLNRHRERLSRKEGESEAISLREIGLLTRRLLRTPRMPTLGARNDRILPQSVFFRNVIASACVEAGARERSDPLE